MKSFTIVNNHKQWKVSYGEHTYWRLGAAWYRVSEDKKTLERVTGEDRDDLEDIWFRKSQTY